MNWKTAILSLSLLFWKGSIHGQVQNDVLRALQTRDFTMFKNFSDSLSDKEQRISAYWEMLRNLTEEFREGVFIFEKSVPDEHDPNISHIYTFKVKLIATKTKVASYELSEQKNRKVADHWEPYDDPIHQFRDEKLLEELKNSFSTLFHAPLDEQDLFVNNLTYGERCGIVGIPPKGRSQVIQFVKNGNKDELVNWLQSANSEKQVYAVDGLYQLSQKGIKLTENELQMIAFVMHKNGSISVCSGCMHSKDTIKSILSKFQF